MDEWIYEVQGIPSGEEIITRGNNLLCGNGFLGVRGTLDEYRSAQKVGVMVNGLYDQKGDQWSEPVNLPNPLYVCLRDSQGQPLVVCSGTSADHRQGIDMTSGTHWRTSVFASTRNPTHPILEMTSQRFVSQEISGLIVQRLELDLPQSSEMTVQLTMGFDLDIWDINGPHLANIDHHIFRTGNTTFEGLSMETQERGVPIHIGRHARVTAGSLKLLGQCPEPEADSEMNRGLHTFQASGDVNCKLIMEIHVLICHGGRPGSNTVFDDLPRIAARGWEFWADNQRQHWNRLWKYSDIRIEGDEAASRALRFSLYHLLSLLPLPGESLSIPARGLSGQVYKGAVFWDTEIFMLPFYALTHPERARSLLLYRIEGLTGALNKAAQYGYQGAFYAWEAQDKGAEACTDYNITDVITQRPMRTFFREKQIHISADIVFALWSYCRVTGDSTILEQGGRTIIAECARFYLSRCHLNPLLDRYEFLDVTGPDEYHERVHNNFFTNLMARRCLKIALETGCLENEAERRLAAEVAPKLYLPQPGVDSGLIPQFDDYLSLRQESIDQVVAKKLHPNEYLGGENGVARWTQVIKQADVVLALYLFPQLYPLEIVRANWEYYEPRTEHGSSLSATAYAGVAARLGNTEFALRYFFKTAQVDMGGSAKQYVGDLYIGGTHPAAQGGAWQAVVFGFLGLEVTEQGIILNPHLPETWKEVHCPLVLRNIPISITISKTTILILIRGRKLCPRAGAIIEWEKITSTGVAHA